MKHPVITLLTLSQPTSGCVYRLKSKVAVIKEVLYLTANQINYWRHREDQRHNLATETEAKRTNLANEGIKRDTLGETRRHNYATEGAEATRNRETERHNSIMELVETKKIDEARRHNRAVEMDQMVQTGVKLNSQKAQQAHWERSDATAAKQQAAQETHWGNQDYETQYHNRVTEFFEEQKVENDNYRVYNDYFNTMIKAVGTLTNFLPLKQITNANYLDGMLGWSKNW